MTARRTAKVTMVNGRRMRVTRLDACGRVVYGDNNIAISKGFVSVSSSTNTTNTDAVQLKNANGELVVNVPEVTSFSNFGIEISFAEVDPELFALITGQSAEYDAYGNVNGFSVNSQVSLSGQGVALEVWTGSPSGDACVVGQGATGSYGYVLYPFLQGGVFGDYQIAEGGITFTMTGMSSKDGNGWGVGPYNVTVNSSGQPAPLPSPLDKNDHLEVLIVGVDAPAPRVGTRPQMDPTKTAITTIANTNTARAYSFTATPAVAAGVGTWWDFGDGVWDYVTSAGSAVSHTYTAPGNYTVKASTTQDVDSGGSQVVTKAITVT